MADEYLILKDRNAASEAIRHLDEEDLRFLNRRIVKRRMEKRNRSEAKQENHLRPDRQRTSLECLAGTSLADGKHPNCEERNDDKTSGRVNKWFLVPR
jgi:hypothetical protein